MTQASYGVLDPDETSGDELADLLKAVESAGHTTHSGSTRPSYVKPGMIWLDTSGTPWFLKLWSGTIDAIVGEINPTTGAVNNLLRSQNLADLADKAAARLNLGIYRKQTAIISPTATVGAIVVPIPADCRSARLTGLIDVTVANAITYGRLSFDGGGSFLADATGYKYSSVDQYGSTSNPSVTIDTSQFIAALDPADSVVPTQLEMVAIDAMPGKLTRFSSASHASGSGFQERRYQSHGYARGEGPTHLLLYTSTGLFTPNTRLSLEAF